MAATKNSLTSNTRNQYTDKISMSGRSVTFPYCLRTSHSYLGADPESLSTTLTFLLLSLNRPSSNPSDKANAQWNPFSTTAGIGGSHHLFRFTQSCSGFRLYLFWFINILPIYRRSFTLTIWLTFTPWFSLLQWREEIWENETFF